MARGDSFNEGACIDLVESVHLAAGPSVVEEAIEHGQHTRLMSAHGHELLAHGGKITGRQRAIGVAAVIAECAEWSLEIVRDDVGKFLEIPVDEG